MASETLYRTLVAIAIGLGVLILAWAFWDKVIDADPADSRYLEANTLFEDQAYDRAAGAYRDALAIDPDHIFALRGLARSLHRAGQADEALMIYNDAVTRLPEFGATYANRGILLDSLGRHEEALADYDKALELDPTLAEGPHWMTRFLRNQGEAPPTIADRAGYLRQELAKPADERLLRVPEIDEQQRPYKQ